MVHFIWFGPRSLDCAEYLAIKTAAEVYNISPNLWTHDVPRNEWLDKIEEVAVHHQIKDRWLAVTDMLPMYVHKTDYLRYQLLYEYGGLYLDLDTLCIKSILDLNLSGVVLGYEPSRSARPGRANGAVLSVDHPQHPAILAMLDRTFAIIERVLKPSRWNQMGPKIVNPVVNGRDDCTVLPKECFYFHGHWEWREIFKDNPIDERMYVLHWWGKNSLRFVRDLVTPEYVDTSDSLYAKVVRKVLGGTVIVKC